MNLTAEQLLASPDVSDWLKSTLRAALARDPVDAAQDASLLSDVLNARADAMLAREVARLGHRGPGA